MDILVRAFANVGGLGAALVRDGRLSDAGQLRAFATGFSRRQAFFDFVDVGAGKERADLKVQGKSSNFLPPFALTSVTSLLLSDLCILILEVLLQKVSSFSWKVSSVSTSCSRVGMTLVTHHFWGSLLEISRLRSVSPC
jgi:hypothetical protein